MESGDITTLNVSPSMAVAAFNTTGMSVKVGTSSTAGYKLSMSVANGGQLVSGTNSIPSLPENDDAENPYSCTVATGASCNFEVNSWGYRLGTDTANVYKPIPATETEILDYTAGATDENTTDFAFGVRANAKQPGGSYETTINFIATANPEGIFDIKNVQTMQDFAALNSDELQAVIDSMETGTSYELADNRDDETYNVAKLEDGNVWLQDNLRLGSTTLTTNLTSANTNIADSTTIEYDTFNGWSASSGFTSYTVPMFNTSEVDSPTSDPWKYGVYYNYCAASANTYCMAVGSSPGNASYDICPAGWRMPAGDTGAYSYYILYTAYSSNVANFKNALRTPLSGRFYNSSADNKGSYGGFWSSTYGNDTGMRYLYVNGSSVHPQDFNNRGNGSSVRCVLKAPPVNITFSPNGADFGSATTLTLTSGSDSLPYDNFTKTGYRIASWNTAADGSGTSYAANAPVTAGMNSLTLYAQWTTGSWMQRLADNSCTTTAKTVYDVRDGKSYTVQRLNDGLCWMLDNLALNPAAQELNSSNTNVASKVTPIFANKASLWTEANGAYTSAFFNSASKDISVQYGNNSSNKTKVGGYYNYCAASAGTICAASGQNNDNASYDICPAGWKMPNGNTAKGSYYYLFNTGYSGNKDNFKNALHAGHSGLFWESSALGQGSSGYGYFWSATRSDGNYMYALFVNASGVNPQNTSSRSTGYSVRCVLKSSS